MFVSAKTMFIHVNRFNMSPSLQTGKRKEPKIDYILQGKMDRKAEVAFRQYSVIQ